MIRIDRERYLKHTITDLETLNEPSSIYYLVLGNYSCDFDFGNFSPLPSDVPLTQNSEMILHEKLLMTIEEILFCQEPALEEADRFCPQVWTLYFDGSKLQEGSGAGCILIDPKSKRHFLSCRLEFECTNNTAEYEALIQGLKKYMDLNIKELKVFKDSEIIIRQVRNTIHCNSPHLRNY
jgi:hypothetical protein